jgi:hypothetical protein
MGRGMMSDLKKGMQKLADKKQKEFAEHSIDQFFRVKDVTLPNDHFPAWEIEMVTVQGTKLLKRESITKRDLKAMALATIQEIMEDGGYRPEVG